MRSRRPDDAKREAWQHELMLDLAQRGCPACRVASRLAGRFLEALFWESVNDPALRSELRAAHGFCRPHTMRAAALAQAKGYTTGMAILYADLLGHLDAEAEQVAATRRGLLGSRRVGRGERLTPHAECPVCASSRWAVDGYLELLARRAADSEVGLAARDTGRGLCVAHLRRGLTLFPGRTERHALLEIFRRRLRELRSSLGEYVRKHGYQFQHERIERNETDAWRDAVELVAGESDAIRKKPGRGRED